MDSLSGAGQATALASERITSGTGGAFLKSALMGLDNGSSRAADRTAVATEGILRVNKDMHETMKNGGIALT